MMRIRRGDIFIAELIGVGSMQTGFRPVVIVSNNKANKYSQTVTVIPFTTSKTKVNLPTHVDMDECAKTHTLTGIALAECIMTIDKTLLERKIGTCSAKEILRINVAILIQVGIDIFEVIKDCTMDMFNCLRRNDEEDGTDETSFESIGTIGSYLIETGQGANFKGKRR